MTAFEKMLTEFAIPELFKAFESRGIVLTPENIASYRTDAESWFRHNPVVQRGPKWNPENRVDVTNALLLYAYDCLCESAPQLAADRSKGPTPIPDLWPNEIFGDSITVEPSKAELKDVVIESIDEG